MGDSDKRSIIADVYKQVGQHGDAPKEAVEIVRDYGRLESTTIQAGLDAGISAKMLTRAEGSAWRLMRPVSSEIAQACSKQFIQRKTRPLAAAIIIVFLSIKLGSLLPSAVLIKSACKIVLPALGLMIALGFAYYDYHEGADKKIIAINFIGNIADNYIWGSSILIDQAGRELLSLDRQEYQSHNSHTYNVV